MAALADALHLRLAELRVDLADLFLQRVRIHESLREFRPAR